MSKHWVPGHDCVQLRVTKPPARSRLAAGSKAGLLLVAVACAGVVFGLNQAFARHDVFAGDVGSQIPRNR